jgi:hypothetical protein
MKVLIACEESQTVCKAFRELGHEAYSNDIQECSGGHPEWHLNMDCFHAIELMDWDLMIAHPPCTYLSVTGNKWMKPEFINRFPNRKQQRSDAIDFFLKLTEVRIKHWAIENPVCIMSTEYRKPDQYIQPYYFGEKHSKKTALWLKNLPKLTITNLVEPEMYVYKDGRRDPMWHYESMKLPPEERAKIRSRTFSGIAQAMATQWSKYIIESSGTENCYNLCVK